MSAVISDCGRYRYELTRGSVKEAPRLLFIMLNPSTADAEQDDPTIRRCRGYAEGWGFVGFTVANLFAFRATDPKALRVTDDPIGPENDLRLRLRAAEAEAIVLAWGAQPIARERASHVIADLWPWQQKFHVLGYSKGGEPNHPLMMPKGLPMTPWAGRQK